jgi:hypothetical protein
VPSAPGTRCRRSRSTARAGGEAGRRRVGAHARTPVPNGPRILMATQSYGSGTPPSSACRTSGAGASRRTATRRPSTASGASSSATSGRRAPGRAGAGARPGAPAHADVRVLLERQPRPDAGAGGADPQAYSVRVRAPGSVGRRPEDGARSRRIRSASLPRGGRGHLHGAGDGRRPVPRSPPSRSRSATPTASSRAPAATCRTSASGPQPAAASRSRRRRRQTRRPSSRAWSARRTSWCGAARGGFRSAGTRASWRC